MQTNFDFLPEDKKVEIAKIRDLVLDHVEIEMMILFGSYARSQNKKEWVKHKYVKDGALYEYNSDFDFLIVVKNKKMEQDTAVWDLIEAKAYSLGVRTWFSFIVDNIHYVNEQLELGRYFYSDIKKEGIVLYDSNNYKLAEAKDLSLEQKREMAKKDYEYWVNGGEHFLEDYHFNLTKRRNKMAVFFLHQAAERFLSALLLVFSGYRPKTHDLKVLLSKAEEIFPECRHSFFPGIDLEYERKVFELLRLAYVDARYEEKYSIDDSELKSLETAVFDLKEKVKTFCLEKI